MNVRDRYNRTISLIDNLILSATNGEYPSINQIMDEVCAKELLSIRQINDIFQYLNGHSLRAYIKERKMMAVYKDMLAGTYNLEEAIKKSGYDNQSSFGKEFKHLFDISPEKANEMKDKSKYKEALLWEQLTNVKNDYGTNNSTTERILGFDANLIRRYEEMRELQAKYDLSDIFVQVGYEWAEEWKVDINRVFDVIENIIFEDDLNLLYKDIPVEAILSKKEYIYLYSISDDMTFSDGYTLLQLLKGQNISIFKEPKEKLKAFINKDCERYEYYSDFSHDTDKYFQIAGTESYADFIDDLPNMEMILESGTIDWTNIFAD